MPNKKKKHNHIKKRKLTAALKHEEQPQVSSISAGDYPSTTEQFKKVYKNKPFDYGGVKRIYSPFNRFANSFTKVDRNKTKKMSYQGFNRCTGLSPKEKSYVICSCESRSRRYSVLKVLAADAIRDQKIFSIYGNCIALRNALVERGWVEKIPPHKMNLSKIRNGTVSEKSAVLTELERLFLSNLVEKYPPNFIWNSHDDNQMYPVIDMSKCGTTIINMLRLDALWTTKQGLCYSMKQNYWFYIEDVAEVNSPRTYNSYDSGEMESFIKDFKITACTSLLKWVLSMVANERPIFAEDGKISISVLIFALNRCKEYLFRKQNKDIDRNVSNVSGGQWNVFIKKYYRIIARDDVFQLVKDNKLPVYLGYAKYLLKEMHRYRPQLSCEGCHNIWIIKPAHCSRGKGIRMASKLGVILDLLNKANTKYVIQKYIEEPLLIHETKFDLRQYYLVTSTYPLVIWMYQECYLKFSTQKYNLKNYHESIHLTNNAVQRRYENCVGRHADLPPHNMWDLSTYKEYLKGIGKPYVWEKIIYPGMKKTIIGIMLSCQDTMGTSKNRFELYGCDFILDKEFKPWLIEINSHPDLNHTTPVTAKICPEVVTDIVKVVIDRLTNPKAPTGKFECIYRQPMSVPRYGGAADLYIRGYSLRNDYFYRGTIPRTESIDSSSSENDMDYFIDNFKFYNDADIMIEPEDDSDVKFVNDYEEINNCDHMTKSDTELNVAANVITDQLDELIEKIVSEQSGAESFNETKSFVFIPQVSGCGSHKTTGITEDEQYFTSSKQFKENSLKLNPFEKPKAECLATKENLEKYEHFQNALKRFNLISASKPASKNKNSKNIFMSDNNFLQATSNIITFINEREKEYFSEKNYSGK